MTKLKFFFAILAATFVAMLVLWRDGIKQALFGAPKAPEPEPQPEPPVLDQPTADRKVALGQALGQVSAGATALGAKDKVEVGNEIVKRRRGRPRKVDVAPAPVKPAPKKRRG